MQSRYVLAICAFALFVGIVSAQQADQSDGASIIEKLKESAEHLIRESIVDFKAAMHCVKEAGEHCKDQLKYPLINYVQCSVDYLKANKDRCKQESEKQ